MPGARCLGGSWRRWVFSERARTSLVEDGGLPSPLALGAWISRLHAVVIPHGYFDHIGGMHAALNNSRPRELWIGPLPPIPAFQALLEQANNLAITIVRRSEGDLYEFGGTRVTVFAPPSDGQTATQPRNNDSLVLHFGCRDSLCLLEGHAEKNRRTKNRRTKSGGSVSPQSGSSQGGFSRWLTTEA